MKQIPFNLVTEEHFEYFLEDLLFDHIVDWHGIFRLDDCFEEFDYFDVGLDRLVQWALGNFHQDFVVYEVVAQLIRVNIVNDEFVQEL